MLGAPGDRAGDLVDRRLAVEHVFDPLSVDLVVGDVRELRARLRQLADALRKLEDRDALGRADVEDLTRDLAGVHQPLKPANRVLHVAEAARLRAVTVDLEWPSGERGGDEAGDHHSVLPALPRP